jgi:hypothetical protein
MGDAHLFKPGNQFSTGRPAGARNKGTYELRERLKERGDIDPAEFLSNLISSSDASTECKIQASGQLLPYYHSKLGATPVPPPPVYLEEAIHLPRPTTVRLAYENIALLTEYKSTGKIDVATANSLIEDQKVILYALIDEAKLLAQSGQGPEPLIRIEGGLPRLLGTDIIMPGDLPAEDWGWTESVFLLPKPDGHDLGQPGPNGPQTAQNDGVFGPNGPHDTEVP